MDLVKSCFGYQADPVRNSQAHRKTKDEVDSWIFSTSSVEVRQNIKQKRNESMERSDKSHFDCCGARPSTLP
jgi:hypothetical protein